MQRALLIILAVALATAGPTGQQWTDPTPRQRSFVGIEPGVVLEVLDWGGSGPPLIFPAGLGNTAHVFDTFALHFIDRFHVLGITRRGYGASSRPEGGYDIATLANDVRTALDRVGVRRAVLIGHLIAGDELTKFASAFADRVSALVYLDAAYDRTHRPTAPGPDQHVTNADLSSAEQYNAFALRTLGIRFPVSELHAMAVFDATGRVIRVLTPNTIADRILAGLEPPGYKEVHAPALAIYQPNELRLSYPNYDALDDANRSRADDANKEVRAWAERSIVQFRTEVVKGRVVVLNTGSHYMFITNEMEVVRLIRDFLAQVLP